jgi:desulfoferrodoxin-like iron-binding protein
VLSSPICQHQCLFTGSYISFSGIALLSYGRGRAAAGTPVSLVADKLFTLLPVREAKEVVSMAVEKVGEKCRCNVCGNGVTVTKVGGGTLVCCGEDMEKIE